MFCITQLSGLSSAMIFRRCFSFVVSVWNWTAPPSVSLEHMFKMAAPLGLAFRQISRNNNHNFAILCCIKRHLNTKSDLKCNVGRQYAGGNRFHDLILSKFTDIVEIVFSYFELRASHAEKWTWLVARAELKSTPYPWPQNYWYQNLSLGKVSVWRHHFFIR